MTTNMIYNENCLDLLKRLPDNSVDFTAIDPPYTDGTKDVLAGHKIQTKLDIKAITKEIYRVQKPNTFYAFFGQMPTILAWYNAAAEAGFTYKEDIAWIKRVVSNPYLKIHRTKESIFIMQKGEQNFYQVFGNFEDIKMPAYLDGLQNIDTIKRSLIALKSEKIKYEPKKQYVENNDKIYSKKQTVRNYIADEYRFTNVWSFLPHNKSGYNKDEFNVKHPTVKPIPLLERLIELCTPSQENIAVLDCFLGSGTTALACINTNRQYIGCELHREYYEIAKARIAKAEAEKAKQLFTA